jgi:hypothetical protein
MDPNYKFPGSPSTPLFQVSPERVNQQRNDTTAGASPSIGGVHSRDSSVFEKVAKFDSLASQSKALERKANDAALKRAMVGREEAEGEMRRYREEVRVLRKQVEEGSARERKVGERLETVMVGSQIASHRKQSFLNIFRKIMAERKRHMHIPRPCGRKRYEEQGKSYSGHSLLL